MKRRWLKMILFIILILLISTILVLYWPITYTPTVQSKPAMSYDEAISRLVKLQARDETVVLYPGCETQAMTHGQQVERVVVLLHGYRNCPKQFQQLGLIFYDLGYNVIIPRLAHHGLADLLTTAQAELTADELTVGATEAIDIAQGLGQKVTVVGLSTGGLLAGWATHHRSDIERAVLIAPVFGLQVIPAQLTTPATNLFLSLPNFFVWQNDALKTEAPNAPQVYPRNSTRAISQIIRLAFAVRAAADHAPPSTKSIMVITNANDTAVDNQITAEVVSQWRKQADQPIKTYEFAADQQLDHDLIDPDHPKQKVDLVYPILVELIMD